MHPCEGFIFISISEAYYSDIQEARKMYFQIIKIRFAGSEK